MCVIELGSNQSGHRMKNIALYQYIKGDFNQFYT